MKKPELLVTPASVDHMKELIEAGADAFLVGRTVIRFTTCGRIFTG